MRGLTVTTPQFLTATLKLISAYYSGKISRELRINVAFLILTKKILSQSENAISESENYTFDSTKEFISITPNVEGLLMNDSPI